MEEYKISDEGTERYGQKGQTLKEISMPTNHKGSIDLTIVQAFHSIYAPRIPFRHK